MWSSGLAKALDRLGVNKWMRKRHYESSILWSVIIQFDNFNEDGVYRTGLLNHQKSGSTIEGTRSFEEQSDFDTIIIHSNNVIEQGKYVENESTVVVLTDLYTPPGFVKLKVDERCDYKDIIVCRDKEGNYFLSNGYRWLHKEMYSPIFPSPEFENHGPALTVSSSDFKFMKLDSIIAFHCRAGLSFNQEYFRRTRRFGWPSESTLTLMKSQGCLLVPTGHSQCDEKNRKLQWRISFSFQERHLMINLNSAQYKCYVLLKMIKNCHIRCVDLTSYHCKTTLFYTIENTPNDDWREDNLLNCLILCLKRLKIWSMRHNCPNYFLPELNLFTGKVEIKDMCKLTNILSDIIQNPRYFIRHISAVNFERLVLFYADQLYSDYDIEKEADVYVAENLRTLLTVDSDSVLNIRKIVLQKICYKCNDVEQIICRHYKWLKTFSTLQSSDEVGHISLDGIQWVIPHVGRFLHSSLASHLAIKATETDNPWQKSWYIATAAYHYSMGLDSDALSGKLKLATFLLYTRNLTPETLRSVYGPKCETLSVCACREDIQSCLIEKKIFESSFAKMFISSRKTTLQMSVSHFLEKYVSACTIFMPSESKLTLYPLKFEMYRSFGCTDQKVYETEPSLFERSLITLDNCATIDSKAYFYILSVYAYNENEYPGLRLTVYMPFFSLLFMAGHLRGNYLAHRETVLNFLGWIASSEEINNWSLAFYKWSWDVYADQKKWRVYNLQPKEKNAAKWHLVLLLFRAWIARNQ